MSEPAVVLVAAGETHELRRRILRGGDGQADVQFPTDNHVASVHLGIRDASGKAIAVVSIAPVAWPAGAATWPGEPGPSPWQLRGMAVDTGWQRHGLGARLLAEAVSRAQAGGASVVWANARDTALVFYERHGWDIVGPGFVTAIGVAHHLAVRRVEQ